MTYDEKTWLSHYDEATPSTITYPKVPLHSFLEQAAFKYPENQALSYLGREISYCDLDRLVNKAANSLLKLGVKKGDRVGLYLSNTPQFIIGLYGTLKIGAIAVPINPLFQSAEVSCELEDAGIKTVIVMSRLYPVIKQIREECGLKNVIVTDVKAHLPFFTRSIFALLKKKKGRVTIDPMDHWLETLIEQSDDSRPDGEIDAEDIALLQYTSGTSGVPKGVMLSHYNLVVNALQWRGWISDTIEGQERVLGWLPFFHSFGMTACLSFTISSAGTLVLVSDPKDLGHILKSIEKEKITIIPGVPTMYAALGSHKHVSKYDLSTVKVCISGGAPLMESIKRRFVEVTGSRLLEGYGLSEASPITHANPVSGVNKIESIGLPLPDTKCKIVDLETGDREVEVGEEGEMIVRGPQVMRGYWEQPEMTDESIRDGWLYTGDVVKMDEEGYFHVVDRKKDIIIVKGFNVSPTEVEKVITTHPKVLEAAVVGIPHELKGEEIKAYIVFKEGEEVEKQEIIDFLRSKIARFKVPSSIEIVDALPKNVMGKLLRRVLLDREMKKGAQE